MRFGVDYYPEHWAEERWEADLDEMVRLGFNIVRVGEFAWSRFEPRDGDYRFDWLDRFLGHCAARGIEVMLGLPARNIPAWLMDEDPGIAILNAEGQRETFGSRYTVCINHPLVEKRAMALTAKLAERYAEHPAVTSWHLDNEYGDGSVCFCGNCRARFIEWLKGRYGTVERLNEKWGLVFWSLELDDWKRIRLPAATNRFAHNPALLLDFRRFGSFSTERFVAEQAKVVRSHSPKKPVTTNFQSMTRFHTDYRRLAESLDFASMNYYPPESYTEADFDIVRGTKGRGFWVVEQKAGPPGFAFPGFLTPRPGETRMHTWSAVAHGADAILYFRFRPCPYGQEQHHMGVVNYDGSRNRVTEEIAETGRELLQVSDLIAESEVRNEAALLYSWENRWALERYRVHPDLDFRSYFLQWHREFEQRHIGTDIISPDDPFEKYKLIVVPLLCLMSEETARRLAEYVHGGGTILFGTRSGVKDVDNAVVPGLIPLPLREALGIEVAEAFSLKPDRRIALVSENGKAYAGSMWVDLVEPKGAQVLFRYGEDWFKDRAAVTRNRFGKGTAYYFGTVPDPSFYEAELTPALNGAGLRPVLAAPRSLRVLRRAKAEGEIVFILNPGSQAETVAAGELRNFVDAATGLPIASDLVLRPFGVRVLRAGL